MYGGLDLVHTLDRLVADFLLLGIGGGMQLIDTLLYGDLQMFDIIRIGFLYVIVQCRNHVRHALVDAAAQLVVAAFEPLHVPAQLLQPVLETLAHAVLFLG